MPSRTFPRSRLLTSNECAGIATLAGFLRRHYALSFVELIFAGLLDLAALFHGTDYRFGAYRPSESYAASSGWHASPETSSPKRSNSRASRHDRWSHTRKIESHQASLPPTNAWVSLRRATFLRCLASMRLRDGLLECFTLCALPPTTTFSAVK